MSSTEQETASACDLGGDNAPASVRSAHRRTADRRLCGLRFCLGSAVIERHAMWQIIVDIAAARLKLGVGVSL